MLEEKRHLPAVLQSLGCIAQAAMPVFETRENEIEKFIKNKILECSSVCICKSLTCAMIWVDLIITSLIIRVASVSQKSEDNTKDCWDDKSELCLLKVVGVVLFFPSF
jgi:sister-chromatid-cohesion protein PDS5